MKQHTHVRSAKGDTALQIRMSDCVPAAARSVLCGQHTSQWCREYRLMDNTSLLTLRTCCMLMGGLPRVARASFRMPIRRTILLAPAGLMPCSQHLSLSARSHIRAAGAAAVGRSRTSLTSYVLRLPLSVVKGCAHPGSASSSSRKAPGVHQQPFRVKGAQPDMPGGGPERHCCRGQP